MVEEKSEESKKVNKKQTAIGCGVLLAIIILISVVIGTCLIGDSTDTRTPDFIPDSTPVSYPTVVYVVSGSASYASVTLNNGEGGTEQYGKVAIPWSYTDPSFADNFLYISAQNQGDRGTVTVKIYVDGVLFKTSSSSGAYVIATASGSK